MKIQKIEKLETISDLHRLMEIKAPEHPQISVVDLSEISTTKNQDSFTFSFYAIALKPEFKGKMYYGQSEYDFDNGLMTFVAPHQVFSFQNKEDIKLSGWLIFVHPDFLWNSALGKTIKNYDFFNYSVNEALFLSEKEHDMILNLFQIIKEEYHSRIDKYSKEIIIAQIELLLKYAQRFYQRQFITRDKPNHLILSKLERCVYNYINKKDSSVQGILTVQSISGELNISASYLSRLLQSLTGQTTQHYIQDKLMEKAKADLSTSSKSISEIAFELGFEHPQSFSKLFKRKNNITPSEFRQSFKL